MKNIFFKTIIATSFSFIIISCEDVIDVKLDKGIEKLSVDAELTTLPGPYEVKLSLTAPYFNNVANPTVSGAVVIISDSEGNVDTLIEKKAGTYITTSIQGIVGREYTLTIKSAGQEYIAKTVINRITTIDSLYSKFVENELGFDDGFYVYTNVQEPSGKGDYFRFRAYKNDTLFNQTSDLFYTSDIFVDGNYIEEQEIAFKSYKKGDKAKLQILSITEDAYYFYDEVFNQTSGGGLFADPPANVRTNIFNKNPKGTAATGYFFGSAVSEMEIIVE